MKKIISIAILFSLNAYAGFPFLNMPGKVVSKSEKLECTDFSGKWEGQCTYIADNETQTNSNKVEIQMYSCGQMSIDNNFFNLGGTKTTVDSSKDYNSTFVINFSWNEKNKKEYLKYNTANFGSWSDNSISNGTQEGFVKIVNNRLRVESSGLHSGKSYTLNCEYSKK